MRKTWIWTQRITARLTGQRVRGAFCYELGEENYRLEEFHARLLPAEVENCGSAVVVRLPLEMIALLKSSAGERLVFRRKEFLLRRFPAEMFLAADSLPREWRSAAGCFQYEPGLTRTLLRVAVSLLLSLYGVEGQALALPEEGGGREVSRERLAGLEEALNRCQAELTVLKRRILRENAAIKSGSYTKEAAGKTRLQRRK